MTLKNISKQFIYKMIVENREVYLEKIKVVKVPNDSHTYMVPANITNHKGQKKRGLICCEPSLRLIHPPIYVPNHKGQLVEILETGFIDITKEYSYDPLLDPELFDGESSNRQDEDIPWENFIPSDIPADVAYVFMPRNTHLEEMNEELGKYKIGIPVQPLDSDEYNYDTNLFEVFEFALRKVNIDKIPTTGLFWYLPVDIKFNCEQSRRGYLLYRSCNVETIDVHIFDSRYGLVSALNDNNGLEDCGVFKDDNVFSYQLLLSDVNPAARKECESPNKETGAE